MNNDFYYWLHDPDIFTLIDRLHETSSAKADNDDADNIFSNVDNFIKQLYTITSKKRMQIALRSEENESIAKKMFKCTVGANTKYNVDTVRTIVRINEDLNKNINALKEYEIKLRYRLANIQNEYETLLLEYKRLRATKATEELLTSENNAISCKRQRRQL